MLNFDLNQNPPTATEFEAEENHLIAERRKLNLKRAGVFCAVVVATVGLSSWIYSLAGENPIKQTLLAAAGLLLAGIAGITLDHIDRRLFERKVM